MKTKTYYMVYVEGQSSTTYKHNSLESAEKEAKRLAKQLDKKAYVLCTIKSFEVNHFIEDDCRPHDSDLPF